MSDGIPAPNPSYEIPIHNVIGSNEFEIQNKNFANYKLLFGASNIYSYDEKDVIVLQNDGRAWSLLDGISWGIFLKAGTYTCSFEKIQNLIQIVGANNSFGQNYYNTREITFTLTVDTIIGIKVISNTYPNDIGYVQIEQGTTATDYVEHKEQNLPLDLRSKNLAWNGWAEDFVNRIDNTARAVLETYDNRNCLYYKANAGYQDYDTKYLFKINFKDNTSYTFSFDIFTTQSRGNICIEYTDGTVDEPSNININSWNKFIIASNPNKTIKYLRCFYREGSTRIDLDTFMVLEGAYTSETIPDYEPYYNYELSKIGDAEDYFSKEDSKWYLYKEIGYRNSVQWNAGGQANVFYSESINDYAIVNNIPYCNYFKGIDNVASEGYMAGKENQVAFRKDRNYIRFYVNTSLTLEQLNNLDLEVYYVLATPSKTEITETTLINQLEAIRKAQSYDDQTNITQTNEDLPFILNIEALKK